MKNKKTTGVVTFVIIALLLVPAFAAGSQDGGLCQLIGQTQTVFNTLRILAFLGAGFVLAKAAWDFISTGKVGGKEGVEGLKSVGIPMIIGFALLFSIGIVLSFLMNGQIVSCSQLTTGW
ncbi:MAG: hypothetical protein LBF37_02555 [Rickettsiales bacterium]|nr:hypothetical protein [Rickettsiales bacterium]